MELQQKESGKSINELLIRWLEHILCDCDDLTNLELYELFEEVI